MQRKSYKANVFIGLLVMLIVLFGWQQLPVSFWHQAKDIAWWILAAYIVFSWVKASPQQRALYLGAFMAVCIFVFVMKVQDSPETFTFQAPTPESAQAESPVLVLATPTGERDCNVPIGYVEYGSGETMQRLYYPMLVDFGPKLTYLPSGIRQETPLGDLDGKKVIIEVYDDRCVDEIQRKIMDKEQLKGEYVLPNDLIPGVLLLIIPSDEAASTQP